MVWCDNFNKSGDSLSIPTFSKTEKKGTRYNNFSYELTVFGFFGSLEAKGQGCIHGIPNTMYLRQFYSILPFFWDTTQQQLWRRSQHEDLLNLRHSISLWYFLDVFYHPLLYCLIDHRDHYGFYMHILCISSSRSLYLLFFSISFSAMFRSDGTVIWISLQVEFTESFVIIIIIFIIIIIIIFIIIIVMSSVLVSEKFDQYHPDHSWFCCWLLFV